MYNQTYEDYMRSVLGYSSGDSNLCGCPTYENQCAQPYMHPQQVMAYEAPTVSTVNVACTVDVEEMYPDIYRIVNPMVCKICDENTRPITKERIMEMADTIYSIVETNEREMNRSEEPLRNGDVRNPNVKVENREGKENRQSNFLLRDLILIMLLNRLGGGRPPRPPRPPFPGPGMPPPRPPFPGGPGHGRPPRPQPRDMNDFMPY